MANIGESSIRESEGVGTMINIRIQSINMDHELCTGSQRSVLELKEQLAHLFGVPINHQCLKYRGQLLQNDQLLSSCGIKDGATLHLLYSPQAQRMPSSGSLHSCPGTTRSRSEQSGCAIRGITSYIQRQINGISGNPQRVRESEGTRITISIEAMGNPLTCPEHQTFRLCIGNQRSVFDLKEQIARMHGMPTYYQRLLYRGRLLHNDQLLSSCRIEDGATLQMVYSPELQCRLSFGSLHSRPGASHSRGVQSGSAVRGISSYNQRQTHGIFGGAQQVHESEGVGTTINQPRAENIGSTSHQQNDGAESSTQAKRQKMEWCSMPSD